MIATNMKWIERALSPSDCGCDNLAHVYNDHGQLMATDGHRLHLAPAPNGNYSEHSGFVDGYQGEFPDYRQILPKQTSTIAEFRLTKGAIATLKRLSRLPGKGESCSAEIVIEPRSDSVYGRARIAMRLGDVLETSVQCEILLSEQAPGEVRFGVDLRYLVDAIEPFGGNDPVAVTLKTDLNGYVPGRVCLAPFMVHIREHTAVIMPLRLR